MNKRTTVFIGYCKYVSRSGAQEHEIAVSMLKHAFLEFFHTKFRESAVKRDGCGKPYYEENPNLKFNITHCKEGVAVALCDYEVGIDAESMRQVNFRTVKKSCSRGECSYVLGTRATDANGNGRLKQEETKRFLALWTLKESYVKMTGKGLLVPFDTVCFFPPDPCTLRDGSTINVKGFDRLCRHYLHVSDRLILALTVQREETAGEPELVWKEYPYESL